MDDVSDDGSETSERTVLSESGDEDEATTRALIPGPKSIPVDSVSTTTRLANLWQFLLGRAILEDLTRFYNNNFLPAETVPNIAEGTSYRVSKAKLLFGSQQVVAIKHVIPQQIGSGAGTSDFSHHALDTVLRELRILAHKPVKKNVNVAQLLGYGAEEIQGRLAIYLVAEFASGGTLKQFLTEHGDVSMLDRAHFCYDVASGLAGLHACGIVQGDLKLDNILVFPDKEDFVAKLSDFGSSIFDGDSIYTGTKDYIAPEIRIGRSTGFGSKIDLYASDVFSLGLVIWETMQGGRPFVFPDVTEGHNVWLNELPKDELLLRALQTFETLTMQGAFPKRVIRSVLDGCLRDEPEQRIKCKAIVKIFRSDRIFSNSQRNTSSYINPSRIPPLQKWSFTRTDNLGRSVPFALQEELFNQLQSDVDCTKKTAVESVHFHLAMCHLTGFGTPVDQDAFLQSLMQGTACGEAYSSGMYIRAHLALQAPPTLRSSNLITQVEHDLQKTPNELYYSHRIREHEKVFQRSLLDSPFDLCAEEEILKKGAVFTERDTLDVIEVFLADHSNKKKLLRAVSDNFDKQDFRYVIHLAARLGLKDLVQMFLEAGVDVNTRDENRATPLIAACRGGHAAIVDLLMGHGADSWNRQRDDQSPFHWLMMFEDNEVPSVLAKMRSAHNTRVMDAVVVEPLDLLEHGLRLRWSPVHFAVEVRNMTVTKALLDAGASITAGDTTPLNIAVANHCPDMTRLLLAHGMPSWQRTPFLHIGEVSTIKLLLLHGDQRQRNLHETAQEVLKSVYGDINQKDREENYTSLAEATRVIPCDIDLDVLDCLIDCGARLEVDEFKIVSCLKAREDGRAGIILEHLIRRNAIEVTTGLLVRAIIHGNRQILESVLATGIDVNVRTDENLTPLMTAVLFAKNAFAVQSLINRGADSNGIFEFESDRKSVLQMCLALPDGDGEMLDALINGGASVVLETGSSIVHQACFLPAKVNGAHVLQHLFENHPHLKAFVNLVHENYTPIHLASFCGNLEAVSILLENGAEIDLTTDFNPIATTEHLARNPEDRYVPFERGGFKLEKWKLTAEALLMRLLDKGDPGHGRNLLHIATSTCNYDRVVKLVERGLQPWRGDSKRVTPIGLLPKEVFEYDDEQPEIPPKDFIVQGLKIKEYLELQMVTRAFETQSLDLMDDPPAPMAPEKDSTFQLETHYQALADRLRTELGEKHEDTLRAMIKLSETYTMQERWAEAIELQSLVLQRRQAATEMDKIAHDEVRSSLISTLLAFGNVEEAESLATTALAEAASQALDIDAKPTQFTVSESTTIDRCLEACYLTKDLVLALSMFDMSLVLEARGRSLEAMKVKEKVLEVMRTTETHSAARYRDMIFYLISNYCQLEKWKEAEEQLQYCLYQLDIIEVEHFPDTYSSLLQIANSFRAYSKWEQAKEIYQRLYDHTLRSRGQNSYYSFNTLRLTVNLHEAQINYREAGKSQAQLLETYKQTYGPRSSETQLQKLELARIYEKEDRLVECVILQRQALRVFESLGPESRGNALNAKRLLCKALTKQQILDEAEILAREDLAELNALQEDDDDGGSLTPLTLATMNELALVLNNQDRCKEAITLYKEILSKQRETFGEMHESTRAAMTELLMTYIRANMFNEAEILGKRLVEISETLYGSEGTITLQALFYLSGVYEKSGQLEKSRDMKMQVLELERKLHPPGHKETLYTMTELAHCHYGLGEIDQAITLRLEALDGYRQLDGDNGVKIMDTAFDLACSYHEAAKLEDARSSYEEAVSMSRSILGDQDEKTITKIDPLMALYTEINEYELAKDLAYETLWFMEKAHGDDYPETQRALKNIIIVMTSLEKWREAERQALELVPSLERTHGVDHPDTIDAVKRLAECLAEQRKYNAAEPLYERVLQYNRKHLPPDDESTFEVMESLVRTYRKLHKYSQAAPLNQEVLDFHTTTLGPNHATTLLATSIKANILYSQNRYSEAATLELQVLSARISTLGLKDTATLEAKENLSKTYLAQEKYEDAAMLAEQVLTAREDAETEDTDEDMLDTIEGLKDIYIAAKRWADARKMVDRELIVRQIGKKEKGTSEVIAALKSLKLIAEGENNAEEVAEVVEMVSQGPDLPHDSITL
ncbi:MAG: hypothetical protein Q9226_003512 [Calogaya cf. arnoldii]